MIKYELTMEQALSQKKYFRDLTIDLIDYILTYYSEDKLLRHLINGGYTQRDLVKELFFDYETVKDIFDSLRDPYEGERLG